MSEQRFKRLQQALREAGADVVAIVPGANLFYLAGLTIHLSERLSIALFTADGRAAMVLPDLERPRAAQEARIGIDFYSWRDDEGFAPALERCCADLGLHKKRVAVEYGAMRVLELRALEQPAAVETFDATPLLASLRMVKDQDELAAMRQAVHIVEVGLRAAIEAIRPGITEREVAAVWERAMAEAGAERPSFKTIIASGPNSANPHHTTSDRRLQAGDLVILDGGALYKGYCSDITRTVAVGHISEEARRIYETVLAANAAGRAAVRPGASGAEIDHAARSVIEQAGYGPAFVHRTGHGLGIEIHEPPYLHAGSRDPLPIGATFTVEPGIYLEGIGGVRIEDNVVIIEDGGESLTTFPRDLIIVGQ
ncbi:MAG: peptidase M24 [Herpetosiphonaceae bacterium]|nr:MAG: peptidase M24 [Herpetosiphonaceae bacterium]